MQLQQPLTEIDLDAYFQLFGYSGDCSPRLTTLQAIHQRHSLRDRL
jgi:N-hydroxyarylamine O-acetyltransferase